jgi:dTDP-4-amino-4,6-dideoxygalactose transaminase
MAVNSCGCAMFLALKALDVGPGDTVFVNAHTLTPVPSAIVHSGATPVFVECDQKCVIDIDHFE